MKKKQLENFKEAINDLRNGISFGYLINTAIVDEFDHRVDGSSITEDIDNEIELFQKRLIRIINKQSKSLINNKDI